MKCKRIELNGLWKDDHYGLLVQLHGASVRLHPGDLPAGKGDITIIKAVARVMTGDESRMYDASLLSVMPKKSVWISTVDAKQRGPTMWDITGLVRGI